VENFGESCVLFLGLPGVCVSPFSVSGQRLLVPLRWCWSKSLANTWTLDWKRGVALLLVEGIGSSLDGPCWPVMGPI